MLVAVIATPIAGWSLSFTLPADVALRIRLDDTLTSTDSQVGDPFSATVVDRGEYPNHMIQNLAYCALVEDQMKEHVAYGLVVYAGERVRRVEFTESNRKWLIQTIAAVQAARLEQEAKRNHNQRGRCSGCGVRYQCDQALR
jgi:Domain of unknown function DUF83